MGEIDAGDLLPTDRLREAVLDGEVTQLHRGHRYADEGDAFEIDGRRFVVSDVTRRTLGDLTDADARAEGAEDLAAYRRRLDRVHEDFEWDPDSEVVRHRFEPAGE